MNFFKKFYLSPYRIFYKLMLRVLKNIGQLTIFSNSHMYIFSASSKGSTGQEKLDLAKKLATAVLAKTP